MSKKKTVQVQVEAPTPIQYVVDDPQLIEKLNTKANRGGRESEIPKLFQLAQENVGKWIRAVHSDGSFYNAGAIARMRKKMNLTEKIKIRTIEEDGKKETYLKAVE
jgi:hypothetical protein